MVYCFLADGFEELEAIAPIDMLKRAGVDVKLVGVTGKTVTGSHGITFGTDLSVDDIVLDDKLEAVFLPGGGMGTINLEKCQQVQKAIDYASVNEKLICAICAAPSILGHKGLLKGKNATSFPEFQKDLFGAVISSEPVVRDGNIITAKGAGVALPFALEIVSALKGSEKSAEIKAAIQAI